MMKNSPLNLKLIKTEIISTNFCNHLEIIPGDLTSEIARIAESSPEFVTCATILKAINPKICLDIGTNIGANALFFANHCERVYAFEPNPYIYPVLQRNIKRNKANILAFPFGLSDTASELTFHINCDWNTGASSFISEHASENSQSVIAHVAIGDEVLAKEQVQHVDFIKIDTEGFEANVLLGLKSYIMKYKPVIAIEWNSYSTKRLFKEHNLFKTFFSDYLWFGLGSQWNKNLYSTFTSKIKRGFLKNILKIKKPNALQKFIFALNNNYELGFFIPDRFSHVVRDFSFLPANYIPVIPMPDPF
jgi:FkbM family methyltransferase